ncbi:MAG: heterodisulfide reductase-related iron-sulfur binding cluster [Gemmatimonadota bacterium]
MLRRIDGLDVAKLPSHDRCCGGAGVYNLLQPDLATRVLEPKIDDVRAGAYDWVVTGNPGCLMQIGAGLRDAEIAVPVLHPVELLDLALTPASGRVAEEGGRPARAEARSGGAGRLPDAPAAESMRNGR